MGLATAAGEGGVAIVRMSGDTAVRIFERVFRARKFAPPYESHRLMLGRVMDGETALDEAMGVVMRAPASYTREDVCEIHTHGGAAAAGAVLRLLLNSGARAAEPGEFTRRAFCNGRIDLSQAEAVMGVIGAHSERALRAELRQLEGGSSRFVKDLQLRLTRLLAGLEAHLDYPEEISQQEAAGDLLAGLDGCIEALQRAADERSARLLREGLRVALCGAPNAGKSTLFNALLGEERAIVTDVAGTTRDVLIGETTLDGVHVTLLDTAGLREAGDAVEKIGVARARQAMEQSDALLLVLDASQPLSAEDRAFLVTPPRVPCAVLLSKQDMPAVVDRAQVEALTALRPVLPVCAATGRGLGEVRAFLAGQAKMAGEPVLTHERHLSLASQALARLLQARETLANEMPVDLAGMDIQEALFLLGKITGDSVEDKLLDEIFSSFCVGK